MQSIALLPAEPHSLALRYPGFSSFKTRQSIHYHRRWVRDALIQATLDPDTIELAPSSTPPEHLPAPAEFCFRRRTRNGLGFILLTQTHSDIGGVIGDDRVTVISRPELNREPVASAARSIWAHKRLKVDGGERYRAIAAVSRRGIAPMRDLVAAFRNGSVDPVHQVCSLIANSYLNVDLGNPLGPDSILTIGPALGGQSNGSRPPGFLGLTADRGRAS